MNGFSSTTQDRHDQQDDTGEKSLWTGRCWIIAISIESPGQGSKSTVIISKTSSTHNSLHGIVLLVFVAYLFSFQEKIFAVSRNECNDSASTRNRNIRATRNGRRIEKII